MDVKELLNKAGIEADVQPNEMRYQGIVIHTDAPRDAVEKVLGGMIETLNTADSFNEFEDAMESIVSEDNELFSNDPEEKDQAIKRLNALMAKHFPVGVNGTNGIESLAGIIDDEEFNDSIRNASKENSDACLRPMIMDYVMKRDPQVATRLDTGDMDNEPKEDEAITFEDIKPYVSMYKGDDGKTVFDVLNKDGDSVKKFSDAKAAMEYLHKNFDALRKGEVQKENPEANQDMSMDYEFTGDDGEMAYGTLHYKVVNGKVDPNSLRGESEYNGNHKVDDEFATDMVKPGGADHEDALQAAQDDYDYESDRMRSKFEKADDVVADKSTEVEEFVKSFYDYTNNQFPKGETAVITAVEKKFGDAQIKTAQEAIARLMSDKDPKMSRIKKLAGVQ